MKVLVTIVLLLLSSPALADEMVFVPMRYPDDDASAMDENKFTSNFLTDAEAAEIKKITKVHIDCGGLNFQECFRQIDDVKWRLIKSVERNRSPEGKGCASAELAKQFHMKECDNP